MPLLTDGQIIRDTYEVERYLGEGAFAEVYRVKHRFLGRQAMKVFKTPGMTIAETEALLGEALLLSRIGHPNIIRVFDANTAESALGVHGFFTMEYVAGGSLDQFWRSHGTGLVPVATAVEVMRQVCRGLSVAHAEEPPIVHRDIKPQNILVGYDGAGIRARISDFGLAKRVNPLTLQASARGTRAFKAPETIRDFHSDSCAGDVWALGCTLYLLLTDRLPYAQTGDWDTHDPQRFEQPLVPARKFNIEIDAGLEAILARSLAPDAANRYPDARALLADLEAWAPCPVDESFGASPPDGTVSKPADSAAAPIDENEARSMVAQAIAMSHHAGKLTEAADLLEEAFNRWPTLRADYGERLQLWRRGIAM